MAGTKDISIMMLGARRVGKSSVLSAMLHSLDGFQSETGVSLRPDKATDAKMQEKLTDLRQLYHRHSIGEEFDTQSGYTNDEAYSLPTDALTTYSYSLLVSGEKESVCDIRFTDIRGEDIIYAADDIQKRIQTSSVIIIAIDSVALMEESSSGKNWHDEVNNPNQITKLLKDAYSTTQKEIPQLVLLVPLKCEKYYWQAGGMEQLNECIKEKYKGLLMFLQNFDCFSVAITPILTLGDIVFSRFDENAEGVYSPLYTMRDLDEKGNMCDPTFSPRFCEQPLCYLIKYILSLPDFAKKKKKKGFLEWVELAITGYFFGILGIAIALLSSKSKNTKRDLKRLSASVKLTGDGYEVLVDKLGIAKKES